MLEAVNLCSATDVLTQEPAGVYASRVEDQEEEAAVSDA